jgi:hypothetical protein
LQRAWKLDEESLHPDGRKRKKRAPSQCPAKFKVTMEPNGGIRTIERNSEPHSHDLDYIDAVKRCSGVRSLVIDPLFSGWDSGPILAFLKDQANAPPSLPNILNEAGGKYLDRREIVNICNQKLRSVYPGIDQSALRKQKEKYEGVKTCAVKGCNKSFADAKELSRHKKEVHEQKKHDHSDKFYTCPRKECHRHKKSKGFATVIALRAHMMKMRHWGIAYYHAAEGLRPVEAVTESESIAIENGESIEIEKPPPMTPAQVNQSLQTFPVPDESFLSQLQSHVADRGVTLLDGHSGMAQLDSAVSNQEAHQRQLMMRRLQALENTRAKMETEMQKLRNALYTS